ncbi:hypothetical protein [Halanaerobium salsuginis]|uniref:Uncharacterized protein n=1 Tax=Halanaerobium salsuginis TaxID=29563 RepID=A0A1I4M9M1_9FIRM|nr:hypothetical protein [Halanaerobium salsuginis]SFL99637.1 hypothetical protein SAMN02983006_02538 [Halanaerobium salsuginis]
MLNKKYKEHKVFEEIDEYEGFYESLSYSIMNWTTAGTQSIINVDTYLLSSIKGTLNSIKMILKNGQINDSYALLRKYYDSIAINIYINLYLIENNNLEKLFVEKINNWIIEKNQLPPFSEMLNYIKNSSELKEINLLLKKNNLYGKIRDRCNDHLHYNSYKLFLINDEKIYSKERIKYLDQISNDLRNLFILHFIYLFYLKDKYMMSSDYIDRLEVGLTPVEDSQYWVAPFIQKIFDKIIKTNRNDLAKELKSSTYMDLK